MSKETIKVCCRFRKEFDHSDDEYDLWEFEEETATIYYGPRNTKLEKKWTYDYILPPDTTQEQMYDKVAKKTIIDFTEGYNGTIFAYGQSGSGKTYSMLGPDSVFETLASSVENELYGITPRAVYQIFNIFKDFERNGTKWKLSISYIEIYNEKIKCLFSKKDGLKIREDPNEGFIIPEKESIDCLTPLAVFEGINLASRNRATGATNQNERSSRSHAILQLELIYNSIDGLVRKSHLSLVDLAGSERIAKTGAEGQRLKEAQKINQSLTTLGMVIMSLTTAGSKHIPFRNSKLTLILKDSLGGSAKTTLLCTASRLKRHSEESIQTLYFAARAKTIKNSAKKNIILSAGELQYLANGLKKEIMLLRGQLKNIGYQWRLIEDKKLLSFCNNDEFLNDPNSPVEALDKKESTATNENTGNNDNKDNKENNQQKNEKSNNENNVNNENNTKTNEGDNNKKVEEKNESTNVNANVNEETKNKEEKNVNNVNSEEKKEIKISGDKNENSNKKDEKTNEEKDALIETLKVNMKTERELLQLIIDELYEKLDKKDKENMALLKTISQLNQTLKDNNINITNDNISINNDNINNNASNDNNNNTNNENNNINENKDNNINTNDNNNNINEKKENENNNINGNNDNNQTLSTKVENKTELDTKKNEDSNNLNPLLVDLSTFEKEKSDLQFELEKKNEEIKKITKEKETIEEQNIFISKENQQLKQKINELKLQLNLMQRKSTVSLCSFQDLDDSRSVISKDKSSRRGTRVTFGVKLKKVDKGGVDYLLREKEQNLIRQKEAEKLFKNSDLYKELHKNVCEAYDSPCTVSSNSDILDIDMPELNFASTTNEEAFKKAEEQLYNKELEHLREKKQNQNKNEIQEED